MIDHPLRLALDAETHARPSLAVGFPARVVRLACVHQDGGAAAVAHAASLARRFNQTEPTPDAGQAVIDLPGAQMKWERHGEFSTWTIVEDRAAPDTAPWTAMAAPADWIDGIPGERLVAIRVTLSPNAPDADEARIAAFFDANSEVAASLVGGGLARVYTDFKLGADGYTNILICGGGADKRRNGRLVRRLHEIETYRLMALLGFPVARDISAKLRLTGAGVTDAVAAMDSASDPDAEAALLARLTGIAGALEQIASDATYRMDASLAYAGLVEKRLKELREERLEGRQRLSVFLDRRFSPAMATCAAVTRRFRAQSGRVERASNLLRTRVDIALERQNSALLAAMNERAEAQLRLQETVEGLSVVAISYYALGLLERPLSAIEHSAPWVGSAWFSLFLTVGIVAAVWFGVRFARRRWRNGMAKKN